MKIRGASVYTQKHKFEDRDIYIDGEIITSVCDRNVEKSGGNKGTCGQEIDATGLLAIPGLVDVHLHGAVNHDFCDASYESLKAITEYELRSGVLAVCPTTMSLSQDRIEGIVDATYDFASSKEAKSGAYADIIGMNLEGPFINASKKGAQNGEFITPVDSDFVDGLLDKRKDFIRLLDLAPEVEGNMEAIKRFADKVNISIAHTACDYDTAINAFDNGANHVTHLFNAMNGINHRMPGPIPAALEKNAYVEMITDGVHIHPAIVRMAFSMFGPERILIISDSMEATGMKDGEYELGGQKVTKRGRHATLTNDSSSLAGSVSNQFDCMKEAVFMGIPLEEAVMAASSTPASSVGVGDKYGSISEGYFANILLVDKELNIKYIIHRGTVVE